jgi:hypothetical protein
MIMVERWPRRQTQWQSSHDHGTGAGAVIELDAGAIEPGTGASQLGTDAIERELNSA